MACAISHVYQRHSADIRSAYTRALSLAEQLAEPRHQLRLLGGFHLFLCRVGDFSVPCQSQSVVELLPMEWMIPSRRHWPIGCVVFPNHWLGNLIVAQRQTEAALKGSPASRYASLVWFGFDHHIFSLVALSRTLVLRGFSDRAVKIMKQAVVEADILDHPLSLCFCLTYAAPFLLKSAIGLAQRTSSSGLEDTQKGIACRYIRPSVAASKETKENSPSTAAHWRRASTACAAV